MMTTQSGAYTLEVYSIRPNIAEWERRVITEEYNRLEGIDLPLPQPSWARHDFAQYFKQVRAAEAVKLRSDVVALAGHIVVQNEIKQLYVAREPDPPTDSGWLAPLIGLTIVTKRENDYHDQVHDVLPVVRQKDKKTTILIGAKAALYTEDTANSSD